LRRIVVFGGYGVFGSQVARALSAWGTPLTIAGRNLRQAEALVAALGGDCAAAAADIDRADLCRPVLKGHSAAVNCAGPFHRQGTALLEACVEAGCHYADICDDRGYVALVRSFGERFTKRDLAAVFGCSSLPGISGALALRAREGTTARVERVRVTLVIGNKNPKGYAAVQSLVAGLGKPIATPQGTVFGMCDRELVALPAPFGRRSVFNFNSPEYDLFPSLLGAGAVSVKIGFELRSITHVFGVLACLGSGYGPETADLLRWLGSPLSGLGCSGGVVMSELFLSDGSVRRAALVGRRDGQRMAALPCALVARALSHGAVPVRGAAAAYEFLGAGALLQNLIEAGFELHTEQA
jgi:hypothetical protein